MPASCASLPAPMKRSTCSSDLSILKDEIEEGFAKKDNKRKGSGKDSKPKSAKKIVGQLLNQNKARDTAEHALKVDERLRLARQRREQQQKELASREQGWLAKEERAKRHYEKHLEERRRKLEEQRMREERRRKAVEEKRRQRLNEERERYEQVVKKTMERSQKAKQKLSQLSRQRAKLNANKALRCRPLTEWEKDLVRRLQTPTIAQLARSRSVGPCESDAASCHQVRSSSAHKVESPDAKNHHKTPAVKTHTHPKTPKPEQCKQKSVSPAEKRSTQKNQRTQIQAVPVVRPSPPPDPPPDRPVIRAVTRRPAPQLEGLLPPLPEEEPDLGSSCDTPPQDEIPVDGLTGDQRYMDKMAVDGGPHQEWMEEGNLDSPPPSSNLCSAPTVQNVQAPPAAPSSLSRPSVGTTDPEEASRMLAEKRRQARQQREEKRREEFERQAREELARRQAEENARLQAEVHQRLEEEREMEEEEQKQMEEKKKREEEQQRQTEEENTRRLQRQREEEEARQRETELKRQRDQHFQREEEARQERKRRLEEIMKRTRKADSAERKPAPASTSVTEPQPKENTEPMGNHREDVILLSGPSQPNKLDLDPREEVVPSVAFKERRSLRTLTGLDHIQSQQRAEVI